VPESRMRNVIYVLNAEIVLVYMGVLVK